MSKPDAVPHFKKGEFIGLNLRIKSNPLILSRYFNNGLCVGEPVPPQGSDKTVADLKARDLHGLYVMDEEKANKYLAQANIVNWKPGQP